MMKFHKLLVLSLCLSFDAFASVSLDVYVKAGDEVYAPMNRRISKFNVYEVDLLSTTEKKMSEQLSKDPNVAREQARDFIESGRYQEYAQDIMDGWSAIQRVARYRIDKVPAIVINDRFVVYGMSPSDALRAYDSYILQNGQVR